MQEHMRIVVRCADLVPGLFQALAAEDRKRVKQINKEICVLEEEADRVKNKLRRRLPRTLFMPVGRADILEVLDMQDSIADVAQDIFRASL